MSPFQLNFHGQGCRRAFLVVICLVSIRALPQQKTGRPSVQDSQMPSVLEQSNRLPELQLTPRQRKAVDSFLRSHHGFVQADFQSLHLNDADAHRLYEEWKQTVLHYVRTEGASEQYPFAAWGDLKGNGRLDFVLPFFSGPRADHAGWRHWLFVVFESRRDGTYVPAIAAKDYFSCLDGIFLRPRFRRVIYWCNTAQGQFQWNGTGYEYQRLKAE